MCKKGLSLRLRDSESRSQAAPKDPCTLQEAGTLHPAALERRLPALAPFVAPPSLRKICLSIRKIPLGSLSHPGQLERPAASGRKKAGLIRLFSRRSQGYPGSRAGCLPGRAGEAREGVSKEHLSLWLKMRGARPRDEVGLGVKT